MIKVASRTSKLALVQVEELINYIKNKFNIEINYEIIKTKTKGDIRKDAPLHKLGVRGAFSSEVNKKVLNGDADIAIHSLKDLPAKLPEGLSIVAASPRRDPRDSLIAAPHVSELYPAPGSTIGTSSIRRKAFSRIMFPQVDFKLLRGNVDTRLRKVDNGYVDYAIVAEAALERLGIKRRRFRLPLIPFVPAPGQGFVVAVGLVDTSIGRKLLSYYNKLEFKYKIEAERAFLANLGGACGKPIGGIATKINNKLGFLAGVASRELLWEFIEAKKEDLVEAAKDLASTMVRQL